MPWNNKIWEGPKPEDKILECSCCGFTTKCRAFTLTSESPAWRTAWVESEPPFKYLCELCSGTYIDYPEHHEAIVVLKMISYVGNAILAKLDELKKP